MHLKRRIAVMAFAIFVGTAQLNAYAETDQGSLQKKLDENTQTIQKKESEKKAVESKMENLQKDWNALQSSIQKNKENIAAIEAKIQSAKDLIEKKKRKS